jgi:hypothetical protein
MKKIILALAACFALNSSMAEGEKSVEVKKDKPIISNGFLLNFGVAFPTTSYTGLSGSRGLQFNLELGNQWYFVKNDKLGVGIKVSWAQFGFGSKSSTATSTFGGTSSTSTLDLRFLKVAPMVSLGVTDDVALDFYVDIAPTVIATFNSDAAYGYGTVGAGVLFAPGAKIRYKKLAAGFDLSVGTLSTTIAYNGTNTNGNANLTGQSFSYFIPRVYVGFKF